MSGWDGSFTFSDHLNAWWKNNCNFVLFVSYIYRYLETLKKNSNIKVIYEIVNSQYDLWIQAKVLGPLYFNFSQDQPWFKITFFQGVKWLLRRLITITFYFEFYGGWWAYCFWSCGGRCRGIISRYCDHDQPNFEIDLIGVEVSELCN